MTENTLFNRGKQHFGFNYWASHAGTNMWHEWDEKIIEKDVCGLADAGATVLRVFPMWKDFQPITLHKECFGKEHSVYFKEQPLKFDQIGQAGIDPIMLQRFHRFTEICKKYNIKLIASLLTGWMSGRLLVPPALEGRNVLTDPFCIYWETKFVETFVNYFKENESIAAWELGNETNCMAMVDNPYQAWLWSNTIASAIKKSDATRLVISGMHSLTPNDVWTMQHQAEVCDLLTIHPYTVFTPYCNNDPCTTIKPIVHLAAELCFYRDIGKKPCFTEEIGTTDLRLSEENNSDFVRTNLFSALAYHGFPFLWWCGCYEKDLSHTPYTWGHGERGMGLLLPNGEEKPALNEFRKFKKLCDSFDFEQLPERKVLAHAVLSAKDSWGACFGSFLLSLQNGFDVSYQYHNQELQDSNFYIYPCYEYSSKEEWDELKEKVKKGATLYLSSDYMLGTDYEQLFGFEMTMMWEQVQEYTCGKTLVSSKWRKQITPTTAEVILNDDKNQPVLLKNQYGQGTVYYCPIAIEQQYAESSEVAYTSSGDFYRKIYEVMSKEQCKSNILTKKEYLTGVTEHWISDYEVVVVAVNYDTKPVIEEFKINGDYKFKQVIYSDIISEENAMIKVSIKKNDGCIYILEKK